ncbi:MAG: hypothetical protein Q7S76_02585, partial [bacterium]|nr:hypothetical protein [bacterium]
MSDVVAAYDRGEHIDIETVSPYLSDYNTHTGEMWGNLLAPADAIGIEVAKMFRTAFPNVRMISLYDEYNSDLPDSSDAHGKPTRDAAQLQFSDDVKANFRNSFESILRTKGVINDADKEGRDYILISESEKVRDVDTLIRQLEASGNIRREGEAIWFENPNAENHEYQHILLRT